MRGFVPDLELDKLLRTHSVVMLPYRADFRAQSGVLSQAIAYRVPVVSTDAGAVGDTVRSFNIGCVAPSPSARSLAEAVLRLYRMPPRELEMNLDAAAKTLDWNRVAYALSEAYDNICR
jgi:glycosyltransferase involved in cell wall biosynthesis